MHILALNAKAFDAAWALLIGLNVTLRDESDATQWLMTFNYTNTNFTRALYNNIIERTFYGASVSYNHEL